MVNELRSVTGAGLLDCKKALTEADGNVEQATTILRKKLGSKLDKLPAAPRRKGSSRATFTSAAKSAC